MKSQRLIGTKTPKQDQMTDTQDNVTDNHTIRGPCQIQIQMQIQYKTNTHTISSEIQIQYYRFD